MAGLMLGHRSVVCVVGADHLDGVEAALQSLSENDDTMSLESSLVVDEEYDEPDAPTTTRPLFVSAGGVAAILASRRALYDHYGFDVDVLMATLEDTTVNERFGRVSGMEDYVVGGRAPSLGFLGSHMLRPGSAAELRSWWRAQPA